MKLNPSLSTDEADFSWQLVFLTKVKNGKVMHRKACLTQVVTSEKDKNNLSSRWSWLHHDSSVMKLVICNHVLPAETEIWGSEAAINFSWEHEAYISCWIENTHHDYSRKRLRICNPKSERLTGQSWSQKACRLCQICPLADSALVTLKSEGSPN